MPDLKEQELIDRVVELGFDSVWKIPAPVAVAWLEHTLGSRYTQEDITREVLLNTLTDYMGQHHDTLSLVKTVCQEAYPGLDFAKAPFYFIDWDKVVEWYKENGVLVVGDGHYFDKHMSSWSLTDIF